MAKKTIAIIGATEMIGAAISKNISKGNYRLLLFGHDAGKLDSLAEAIRCVNPEADIDCLHCLVDASWEADIIIIIAVNPDAEKEIAKKIKDFAMNKIVISIPDPMNLSSGSYHFMDSSTAEELQKLLPNSKVVKIFNTADAVDVVHAIGGGKQIDSFIAGDDKEAVQTVTGILTIAGFYPIKALENKRSIKGKQPYEQ